MSRAFPKLVSPLPATPADTGLQVGAWVGTDDQGRPLVSVGGRDAVVARCTVACPAGHGASAGESVPALLFLEDGDVERPIIVGFIATVLAPAPTLVDMQLKPSGATLDGKRLVFEASQEVVLKCGKGSITLQANGRVVIKGTELVSRAEGTNKIRGASVSIN